MRAAIALLLVAGVVIVAALLLGANGVFDPYMFDECGPESVCQEIR